MNFNINKHYLWVKHITIALDVLFLAVLLINYLGNLPSFWKITWIFYFVLAINTGFLALKINKIPEYERDDKSWIYLTSHLFILILVVIAINQFLKRAIVIDYMPYIIGVAIASGFLTFFTHRDKVEKELEDEKEREESEEKRRKEDFKYKFPTLNKIPVLRSIVKWMYKEGWIYVALLVILIILYIIIRVPYAGLDFTGFHDLKYSSYVEPARAMLSHGIFFNEKKYIADPFTLYDGVYNNFGNYPLLEWSLYLTYKILPSLTIELSTRILMAVIGIFLIFSIYFFLKSFLIKKQILIIIYLLTLNPIFNLFTYVTVIDPIMLFFFFLSLTFLINGIRNNNLFTISLSGLIGGIGINMKYAMIIYFIPISLGIILHKFKMKNLFEVIILFYLNALIPTLFFLIGFKNIPSNPPLYILIFLFLILIYIIILIHINHLISIRKRLNNIGLLILFLIIFIITLFMIIYSEDVISLLIKDFITDRSIIFNTWTYQSIINNLIEWVSPISFYLAFIYIISIFLLKINRVRFISLLFLFSSIIYLISASKVIYFHQYYTHILIISLLLFSTNSLIFFIYLYKNKRSFERVFLVIVLFLLILSISLNSLSSTSDFLSSHKDNVKTVSKYLHDNMDNEEFFIRRAPASIGFYSERKSFEEDVVFSQDGTNISLFKAELNDNKNISEVMKKYNIKYYVVDNKYGFLKDGFAFIYSQPLLDEYRKTSFRTDRILCDSKNICFIKIHNAEINAIFDEKIMSYLKLEKKIGNYEIYSFY